MWRRAATQSDMGAIIVKHVIEQDAASAKKTLSEMVRGLMPHIISYSVGGLKKRIQLGY